MSKVFRMISIVASGAMLLTVVLVNAIPATSAPGGAAPVTVTNSTANPVPVDVQDASVAVTQSGTWSVGLTGRPSVQQAPAEPFSETVRLFGIDANVVGTGQDVLTVPTGKRFVLEFVSLSVAVTPGQKAGASVGFGLGEELFVPLTAIGIQSSGRDLFRASQEVRAYAEAGDIVSCAYFRDTTGGTFEGACTVSGYFVAA